MGELTVATTKEGTFNVSAHAYGFESTEGHYELMLVCNNAVRKKVLVTADPLFISLEVDAPLGVG